jgi:hypothetical protein
MKKYWKKRKYFVLCCAILIGGIIPAYFFAQQYYQKNTSLADAKSGEVLQNMKKHEQAVAAVKMVQENIKRYEDQYGMTETTAAGLYAQMSEALKTYDYAGVERVKAEIEEEIDFAGGEREAEIKIASMSAMLAKVEKKRDDYKKLGVNVATISAQIASGSAMIAGREFEKVPGLISELDVVLDKMLAAKKEADKIAAEKAKAATVVAPVPAQSNGGVTYERKVVNTSIGAFTADILTVDMNRVIVKTFTANVGDCAADCPVKPLASFVGENGGIAGINGTYFCPPDYAQCAGVKNSFNTLVFDYKTKKYMNSAQNQYSVNPLISFYGDGAHFYTQALGFGRDTSANGVISNHPTLVHNGGVATQVNLDAKSSGKGTRGGIGFRGKTLWAVVTRSATVPESGYVFTALGAEYAMNLDGGGSTALYFGGYKVGPGRLLPNAIVFTP